MTASAGWSTALILIASAAPASATETLVELDMSNFRYCR